MAASAVLIQCATAAETVDRHDTVVWVGVWAGWHGTAADLLESAGAAKAKMLVSAIDSPESNMRLVETAQHFPHLRLMIRAENQTDAYELLDMGVEDIYRESLDMSIRMAADVLKRLGFRSYAVTGSAQNFLKYDEASLRKLAADRHNSK